ncbi:phosphatases II [Fomitopsis schrenkii]|uniref:Phosphatases II n=1 Tax=Fomitopsis schrenkii TaxID=2126942 RepID=S8EHH7_FOMSC|nr:phosphatases II [Fomitopsis schrenkii]
MPCTANLSNREPIQLLPDAGSHDWPTEARFVEVAQLVRLASQHHASEYSRLKFGPQGCPVAYVPFSLQMPERVRQLQAHQAQYASRQAWWLCDRTQPPSIAVVDHAIELEDEPRLMHPSSVSHMRDELQAALSSTFIPPRRYSSIPHGTTSMPVKTSESHPINISPVVPMELLRIVSAHFSRNDDSSPTMLDLPPSYFLDRLISHPPSILPGRMASPTMNLPSSCPSSTAEQPVCSSVHSLNHSGRLSHLLWNNPTLRRAIQLAGSHSHGKRSKPTSIVTQSTLFSAQTATIAAPPVRRPNAKDLLRRSLSTSSVSREPTPSALGDKASLVASKMTDVRQRRSISYPGLEATLDTSLLFTSTTDRPPVPTLTPEPRSLGNMYLSSCPGKKVRLSGPVKGKCGVCRDLRMDLQRIKDFGVACIVCCLDDEELRTLGVPWAEYSSTADELGLDVLRIPTPEGLTPASISDFDVQLDKLIESYTLDGKPVLVHCRGGVGRAGLVACCWMLRLGLCGWMDDAPLPKSTASEDLLDWDAQTEAALPIRRDTMQLVERVISVIRRRRSPKAVETYEQVRFLVDFVEFQRSKTLRDDSLQ